MYLNCIVFFIVHLEGWSDLKTLNIFSFCSDHFFICVVKSRKYLVWIENSEHYWFTPAISRCIYKIRRRNTQFRKCSISSCYFSLFNAVAVAFSIIMTYWFCARSLSLSVCLTLCLCICMDSSFSLWQLFFLLRCGKVKYRHDSHVFFSVGNSEKCSRAHNHFQFVWIFFRCFSDVFFFETLS